MKLSEVKIGQVFKIGEYEFIKLKDNDEGVIVVMKECVFNCSYGENNNFAESRILKRLNEEVLPKIEVEVGKENVLELRTDLTSLDGLKTYGSMTSKISIPTFDFYRNNVEIFDKYKYNGWWWLSTPDTTPEHYNNHWSVCVSPSGDIDFNGFSNYGGGVRPVLNFVSSIFVSNEQ